MYDWNIFIIVILELIFLHLISRRSITMLFHFFHHYLRNKRVVYSLIALLFMPGTIIHELSHFFVAIVLFLRVREISIFPDWQGNQIKLGSVLYEKKDPLRGILVGIAPLFIGLFCLYWLSFFLVQQNEVTFGVRLLFLYLIFVISTTMFSSKQDLVDGVYVLPILLILAILSYVLQIDYRLIFALSRDLVVIAQNILYALVKYLALSLGVHLFIIGSFELWKRIIKK